MLSYHPSCFVNRNWPDLLDYLALLMNNDEPLFQLIAGIDDGRILLDKNGVALWCNERYSEDVGLPRDAIIGKRPLEYFPMVQRSASLLKRIASWHGTEATEHLANQHLDTTGGDIDRVTGLPNRHALLADMAIQIQAKVSFVVFFIGMDRFQVIAHSLGRAGGDVAVMALASRLQQQIKSTDGLYRLSTTKFVLLTSDTALTFEPRYAELKSLLEKPLVVDSKSFVMRAHAGVSAYPADADSGNDLLKCAELAYTHAHKSALNLPHLYDTSLKIRSSMKADIEMDLRAALASGEGLHLVFQPKGDIASGKTIGAEALIRWNHPIRGFLLPDQFLTIAHDGNLIKLVDKFVLFKSLTIAAAWKAQGLNCPISINLSIESLSDPSLISSVQDALSFSNIQPGMFEIEIPEGSLMIDTAASAKVLNTLAGMGILVSIDDFGTGYSSFSYLSRFTIHTLKIARYFIEKIDTNPINNKIVMSMIKMAHSLDLQVVAEGVESIDELNSLKDVRCNTVQGFYYGRPMSSDDFIAFATRHLMVGAHSDILSGLA